MRRNVNKALRTVPKRHKCNTVNRHSHVFWRWWMSISCGIMGDEYGIQCLSSRRRAHMHTECNTHTHTAATQQQEYPTLSKAWVPASHVICGKAAVTVTWLLKAAGAPSQTLGPVHEEAVWSAEGGSRACSMCTHVVHCCSAGTQLSPDS